MVIQATVRAIEDGDTFYIFGHILFNNRYYDEIRIANVDTPERNQPRYAEATRVLGLYLNGKTVLIEPLAVDRQRLVANVWLNKKNVASLMEPYDKKYL